MRRTLGTLLAALVAAGALTAAATFAVGSDSPVEGARFKAAATHSPEPSRPPAIEVASPTGAVLAEMDRRLGTPRPVARTARRHARRLARIQARLERIRRAAQAAARAARARRAAQRAAASSGGDPKAPYWWDQNAASMPARGPSNPTESQWLASGRGGWVEPSGYARAPASAPPAVKRVIQAGNLIARSPYRWGGGHGAWRDNGYDCSGSVSYALAAGGMLGWSQTSGQLMSWGDGGPGRWLTVYASPSHVFMVVAGLRFDTSGRAGDHASRWQLAPRSAAGFEVRHYPGL